MSEEIAIRQPQFTVADIEKIGQILSKSQLFGVKTTDQAIALCLVAHAEGRHPALAAMDYDIIQGRPALKADAMLARFQESGGLVKWLCLTDECAKAEFSHPQSPNPVAIEWNENTVAQAGLNTKDMHRKYPRQMKRARVISEGIRTCWPAAGRLYTPEEVNDFEPVKGAKDVTESVVTVQQALTPTVTKPAAPPKQAVTATAKPKTTTAAPKPAPKPEPVQEQPPQEPAPDADDLPYGEPTEPTQEAATEAPAVELLDEKTKQTILTVFKSFKIGKELIESVVKAESEQWNVEHRAWLLERYHEADSGKIDAIKFAGLEYPG